MADAIAITVHQLPQSLGERAAKAFDIQRFVDVLSYALQTIPCAPKGARKKKRGTKKIGPKHAPKM